MLERLLDYDFVCEPVYVWGCTYARMRASVSACICMCCVHASCIRVCSVVLVTWIVSTRVHKKLLFFACCSNTKYTYTPRFTVFNDTNTHTQPAWRLISTHIPTGADTHSIIFYFPFLLIFHFFSFSFSTRYFQENDATFYFDPEIIFYVLLAFQISLFQ